MEKVNAFQSALPAIREHESMGPSMREIVTDYYVDASGAPTKEFLQVCDSLDAMVIGHEVSGNTSILIPQDTPIKMEYITSQLADIGVEITGTNF